MVSLASTYLNDLLRNVPGAVSRLDQLEREHEPRSVTPPAAAEVLVGAHRFGGKSLRAAQKLLHALQWLEFDLECGEVAGRIEAYLIGRGAPLGASDLYIAAISLRHGHRLLTRDGGFARVKGLQVENYCTFRARGKTRLRAGARENCGRDTASGLC